MADFSTKEASSSIHHSPSPPSSRIRQQLHSDLNQDTRTTAQHPGVIGITSSVCDHGGNLTAVLLCLVRKETSNLALDPSYSSGICVTFLHRGDKCHSSLDIPPVSQAGWISEGLARVSGSPSWEVAVVSGN